jgi:hypothetical protein
MGWASGDEVFEPVANKLIELCAPAEMKRQVCSVLIDALQNRGWDTESESLGNYQDDPAIIAAFRENDILLSCWDLDPADGWTCELERGHAGDHEDNDGHVWPQAEGEI